MERLKVRQPVAAGPQGYGFYLSDPEGLKKQIATLIDKNPKEKEEAIGCVLPHAGYIYSGKIAAETLNRINIRNKVILLGPNHTGNGAPYSIMPEGAWLTPLGEVRIDSLLAKAILKDSKYLQTDTYAHLGEHSLEVELPILQYLKKDFEIVPIVFMSDDLTALKNIGKEIAKAVRGLGLSGSVLLAASSDLTHYEPEEEAKKKDLAAIEAILELSPDKLMESVRRLNISMCGYAPVIAMLEAAKGLGAKKAELIKYQTSGESTGDKTSVVGYAGIIIY